MLFDLLLTLDFWMVFLLISDYLSVYILDFLDIHDGTNERLDKLAYDFAGLDNGIWVIFYEWTECFLLKFSVIYDSISDGGVKLIWSLFN